MLGRILLIFYAHSPLGNEYLLANVVVTVVVIVALCVQFCATGETSEPLYGVIFIFIMVVVTPNPL